MNTVSVVIPCYNAEAFAAEAVESALAQKGGVLEVIAVDDGSGDGTLEVLRHYENTAGIRVITGPNAGGSAARNRGLRAAGGDYIQFLDADDVILPVKVQHQLRLAKKGGADLVVGDRLNQNYDGSEEVVRACRQDPWIGLVTSRLGITSSNLWRRGAVQEAGGFDESAKSSQEYDLMFRMMQRGCRVQLDDQVLTIRRELTPVSVSRNTRNSKADILRLINLRLKMYRHLAEDGRIGLEVRTACLNQLFRYLRWFYAYDPELCQNILDNHFPPDYVPVLSKGIPLLDKLYGWVYRRGGMGAAENLTRVYRHWRR